MFLKVLAVFAAVLASTLAQKGHYQAESYASFTSHVAPSKIVSSPIAYAHPIAAPIHKPAPVVYSFASAAPAAHYSAPISHYSAPVAHYSTPIAHHAPAISHSAPSHHVDYYAEPKYEYKYGVEDSHTGDKKSQSEQRDGDHTTGEYSLVEPDGTILTVKYQVIGKSGFVADVQRTGHAAHPQIIGHKIH